MKRLNSINPPQYKAEPAESSDDAVIAHAIRILESRIRRGTAVQSPKDVQDLMRLKLATSEYEVFAVLFLDNRYHLIQCEEMFRGTLNQTSVYPREVVKRALMLNAGAVILAHNHPSGSTEPSRADELLTQTLKAALALIDVRVLDHIVVSIEGYTSFAERGLI